MGEEHRHRTRRRFTEAFKRDASSWSAPLAGRSPRSPDGKLYTCLGSAAGHDLRVLLRQGGAAHARVGDAHHVGDPPLQQLPRQGEVADLRHARIALGPALRSTSTVISSTGRSSDSRAGL